MALVGTTIAESGRASSCPLHHVFNDNGNARPGREQIVPWGTSEPGVIAHGPAAQGQPLRDLRRGRGGAELDEHLVLPRRQKRIESRRRAVLFLPYPDPEDPARAALVLDPDRFDPDDRRGDTARFAFFTERG